MSVNVENVCVSEHYTPSAVQMNNTNTHREEKKSRVMEEQKRKNHLNEFAQKKQNVYMTS